LSTIASLPSSFSFLSPRTHHLSLRPLAQDDCGRIKDLPASCGRLSFCAPCTDSLPTFELWAATIDSRNRRCTCHLKATLLQTLSSSGIISCVNMVAWRSTFPPEHAFLRWCGNDGCRYAKSVGLSGAYPQPAMCNIIESFHRKMDYNLTDTTICVLGSEDPDPTPETYTKDPGPVMIDNHQTSILTYRSPNGFAW
jgi:hypothetical protein